MTYYIVAGIKLADVGLFCPFWPFTSMALC